VSNTKAGIPAFLMTVFMTLSLFLGYWGASCGAAGTNCQSTGQVLT
jgi:hypothetical protein